MLFKKIKTENHNKVGVISLNNPKDLNLIDSNTFNEIYSAIEEFEKSQNIKTILIKSICGISKTGEKVFSAGANLKEYSQKFEMFDKNPSDFENYIRKQRSLLLKIEGLSKPVIIAIDGLVVGGFFELALACDTILASNSASFKLNEVNIGLVPGYGIIHRLLRLSGKNRTFEIISSGRELSAYEALNYGIVSEVFDDMEFEKATLRYCQNLAEKSANTLCLIKNTIGMLSKGDTIEDIEVNNFLQAIGHPDSREGIKAFLEKRKPDFS